MLGPSSPETETVRAQFGATASAYATSSYHASGADLAALVREARPAGTERVLDLGSGAGHAALAMAPRVAEVVGVDVTPDMVGVATHLAETRGVSNVRFQVADVSSLPFEDASFDLVTSRVSAHHYADPKRALAEAFRVLRAGGRILLIDSVAPEDGGLDTFVNCVEILRDASHVRDWRCSEWLAMLAGAGFREARVVDQYALPLDGDDWVQRMRTPPAKVEMLRRLFEEATPAQRDAFALRGGEGWGLSLPIGFLTAGKP